MFNMIFQKPSETFVFDAQMPTRDAKELNNNSHIGKIKIDLSTPNAEMIGIASMYASKDHLMFIDGDIVLSPYSFGTILEAVNRDPSAAYCSVVTDLGDIDGYIGGSSSDGSLNVFDDKQYGCDPIDCLQWGCLVLPKEAAKKCKGKPMASIHQLSNSLKEQGTGMFCCHNSIVSYRRMFNLKTAEAL